MTVLFDALTFLYKFQFVSVLTKANNHNWNLLGWRCSGLLYNRKLPRRLTGPHRELSTEKRGKKMKKRSFIAFMALLYPRGFKKISG